MGKKFDITYWLSDDGLERIRIYSYDGNTKAQIAALMGCGLSTLKKYEKDDVSLAKAINAGRDELLKEIEISAFKQAKGYYKTIIEYERVEVSGNDKAGKIKPLETVKRVEREVWVPPDWRATSFIMRNLKPDSWDKLKNESVKAQAALADSAFNMFAIRMEGQDSDDDLGG
ncbi:MAG: hypothetical protein FWE47_00070 [Oscillospiraceae bacterium]|nr:hypothetical protein [Oscillospiraceae bacterium]